MDAVKIVNKINKEHGTIKNVYFLACGGSLVDPVSYTHLDVYKRQV